MFFTDEHAAIINENVLATRAIEEDSIDLIVTSPPYNVDIKYNSNDDALSYTDYLAFSEAWFSRCFQWLKPDGRFCLNIPLDKNKGGQKHVGADLTQLATDLGFQYHSTIIWNKGEIPQRTVSDASVNASEPLVTTPIELIVCLYKEQLEKTSGSRQSDLSDNEFEEWTSGLWTFPSENAERIGHPTPFPIELPHRCIKLFSYVHDTILDPFMGSGTTLVAARLNNRRCIGIEVEEVYCKLAEDRVQQATAQFE